MALKTIQNKCSAIQHRLNRANDLTKSDGFFNNFKVDLDEISIDWRTNFSSFSLINMGHDFEIEGEWEKMAELADIEENFSKSLLNFF